MGQATSNFGQSVRRPIISLALSSLLFFIFHAFVFVQVHATCNYFLCGNILTDTIVATVCGILLFFPLGILTDNFLTITIVIASLHSAINSVIIFLLGLGIRNAVRLNMVEN